MALIIAVSAPGKVILHGEHAVVYGKKAIACAIEGKALVELFKSEKGNDVVISFPKFSALSNTKINISTNLLKQLHQKCILHKNKDTYQQKQWIEDINKFVISVCPTEEKAFLSAVSVVVFSYLKILVDIGNLAYPAMSLCFSKTDLPIGAGLGSSAAFSVSLATAFLLYAEQLDVKKEFCLDATALLKINNMALSMEKLIHGNPSGIDNAVSTYGGAVVFASGKLNHIKFPKLNFLIVDSHVSRSTKLLVSSVKEKRKEFPQLMECLLDSINEVSETAEELFLQMTNDHSPDDYNKLLRKHKELIRINQHLLNCIGVGHDKLDRICQLAESFGFVCKLTGAGGGGCAIILLDTDLENERVRSLQKQLTENGFTNWKATLGCSGVEVIRYNYDMF